MEHFLYNFIMICTSKRSRGYGGDSRYQKVNFKETVFFRISQDTNKGNNKITELRTI